MHRDIKPANILCNDLDDIKITDFGLSKQFKVPLRRHSKGVGTFQYMAPELLALRGDYSTSVDLWALGCIMYELMTGKSFCNKNQSNNCLKRLIKIFGVKVFEESQILVKTDFLDLLDSSEEGIGIMVSS